MELKDITHWLLHRDIGGGGWNCPDETELAAYADGRCEENRRQPLTSHLAECVSCRKQVAFLAREDAEEPSNAVPQWLLARAAELVPERSPAVRPLWWASAAAATACLIFAVALQLRLPTMPPAALPSPAAPAVKPQATPGSRIAVAPAASPAIRGATPSKSQPELLQPLEGATVGGEHLEFRWRPLRECLFYELRMTSADGELMFSERTEATHMRLPSSISLRGGEKYFVWVTAHLSEGKTVKARAIGFRVESPKE